MILVDTELTLDGCAQKVVGAGLGTETLCIIVIMIRGNDVNKRNCRRRPSRGPFTGFQRSEQNDQLTTFELRRGVILPALDITVPGSKIRFKRIRFRLKRVLSRIVMGSRSDGLVP